MKYLLDTHILLWLMHGDRRLSTRTRNLIDANADGCGISSITVWEAQTLVALGRLRPRADAPTLREGLARTSFRDLPVTREIALETARFPDLRDPGDALIAATATVHDLTLLTMDQALLDTPGLRTRGG